MADELIRRNTLIQWFFLFFFFSLVSLDTVLCGCRLGIYIHHHVDNISQDTKIPNIINARNVNLLQR